MSPINYIFVLLAIAVVIDAELVCPGYGFIRPQEPCIDECSPTNDTCASGKKCCYTPEKPCGYRCLVGKNNVPKRGTCPSPQSEQENINWRLCDAHLCDVDKDCSCKKKCCPNMCGASVCISPQ